MTMDNLRLYNATLGKAAMEINLAENPEEEIEFLEWTIPEMIKKLQEIEDQLPEEARDKMKIKDFMEAILDLDEDPETEDEP